MNKTIVIKYDGTREEKEYAAPLRPSLRDLQDAVGGYIEAAPHFDRYEDHDACMYMNEEGKFALNWIDQYNKEATKLWAEALNFKFADQTIFDNMIHIGQMLGDVIVGDVIILVGTKKFVYG